MSRTSQCDAEFHEAYLLAKWLAWHAWHQEFGNDPAFRFDPYGAAVFAEVQRLQHP